MLNHLREFVENLRVEFFPAFGVENFHNLRVTPRFLIRACGAHRVISVYDQVNSTKQGNVGTSKAIGIAASIEGFMMMPDNGCYLIIVRKGRFFN